MMRVTIVAVIELNKRGTPLDIIQSIILRIRPDIKYDISRESLLYAAKEPKNLLIIDYDSNQKYILWSCFNATYGWHFNIGSFDHIYALYLY